MKTPEQLRDELAILQVNRKRQRCGMKPITIDELLQLDPIAYDEYTSDAQAIINHLAADMNEVAKDIDGIVVGLRMTSFGVKCAKEAKDKALTKLSCWRGV